MKSLTPHKLTVALLLLFSPVTAFSQNVAGEWTGKIWQRATGAEFVYAMTLEQSGSTAIGRAITRPADGGGLGEFEVRVTIYSDSILFKDLSVTGSPSPGSSYCIKEGRLNYDSRNNRIYGTIEGFGTNYGIRVQCPSISFDLYRKTEAPKAERPGPRRKENSWAGNGTGIAIDTKGIIATNYHVVEQATEIEADFGIGDSKRSYRCEVLLTDKKNDLAILRIDDPRFSGFGQLPYSFKTSIARVGESVFALGYPKALSMLGTEIKFTRGDISALSGVDGDPTTYTLSLSIQPGNSGGPLFDLNGNLIGITNAKIVSPDVDNVSYAIKSVYLKSFIDLSPYKISLPNGSSLQGKPVVDQIEALSDYVGLIKVRLRDTKTESRSDTTESDQTNEIIGTWRNVTKSRSEEILEQYFFGNGVFESISQTGLSSRTSRLSWKYIAKSKDSGYYELFHLGVLAARCSVKWIDVNTFEDEILFSNEPSYVGIKRVFRRIGK